MMNKLSVFVEKTFILWMLAFAIMAFLYPDFFKWMQSSVLLLLGLIMFGMGLTLSRADFREVLRRPGYVVIGVVGQFLIMPSLAWLLCWIFSLPAAITIGVILVGCCPGGIASNVITLLARGDVALSVSMTAVTTLLAPIATPTLIYLLIGHKVAVPAGGMFWFSLKVVMLPLLAGMVAHFIFRQKGQVFARALPALSILIIGIAIGVVIGTSQAQLFENGLTTLGVVVLHNMLGLGLGYCLAYLVGMNVAQRRTLAIEVGMQNAGLGMALAMAFFSPLAAVPSVLFAVWHNISGAIFAAFVRSKKVNTASSSLT